MVDIKHFSVDYLIDEKISLLQRIAKINAPIEHPPVGYRFPYAILKSLQGRLDDVNHELNVRGQEQKQREQDTADRRDALDIERAFK